MWPKNPQGKSIMRVGELMCRFEVNGAICPNKTCFKPPTDLNKHVKKAHGPDMSMRRFRGGHGARLPMGMSKDEYMIYYCANLFAIARGELQNVHPAPQGPQQKIENPVANDNADNAEEADDSVTEGENEDDEALAAAAAPPPLPAGRIKSFGLTELPSFYNFINPKPPSSSPPSRISTSLKRKFDLHEDWKPKVLKRAKEEDAKIIRRATSESKDTSLAERFGRRRRRGGRGGREGLS